MVLASTTSETTAMELQARGYAFIPGSQFGQQFKSARWNEICETWRRLPEDPYSKAIGLDRRRTYTQLYYSAKHQSYTVSKTPIFCQSSGMNSAFGDLERQFEKAEDTLIESEQLNSLIAHDMSCLPMTREEKGQDWIVDIHQITTYVEHDSGEITPEGIHRDGYQYMAQHFIKSYNIGDGGESMLYNNEKQLIKSVNLNHFMDTVFLHDESMHHAVTPITQKDTHESAYRDMLLLGFQPVLERPRSKKL